METALVDHVQRFLLELGTGFAFVGRQYHLEVGGEDFYLDLLFYHLRLRCYVVIEPSIGIASYRATRALPEELKVGLPDVRQLEEGLGGARQTS